MRLPSPFVRLPLTFDAERLASEARQFPQDRWTYHPLRHAGNTGLPLVSANGETNDLFEGEMLPTPAMRSCPYVAQVMASFNTVIGRSRFMRLSAGADVPSHADGNYTWRNRVRIHVPVITHPDITFSSVNNIDIHMAAGEAWIFDNWRQHAVYNRSNVDRIHLVVDTVGTSAFWDLAAAGWDPAEPPGQWARSVKHQPFREQEREVALDFERFNAMPVRPPDEIENLLRDLLDDLQEFGERAPELFAQAALAMRQFAQDWRAQWALHGDSTQYIPQYALLAKRLQANLKPLLSATTFDSNEANAYEIAAGWLAVTTNASLASSQDETRKAQGVDRHAERASAQSDHQGLTLAQYMEAFETPRFERPVFIVAAPRSGSTMLFEALQKNRDLWTLGDESQREVESVPSLHPRDRDYRSNALEAADYSPQIGALLMDAFMNRLQNTHGAGYQQTPPELRPESVRFLEKTPKNALRIPFFKAMFPDAKFIFLHRTAHANIGSIIDAWASGEFVTYQHLPDWPGPAWSLLLPGGWEAMRGRPVAEIAAWQWAQTNRKILQDLSTLPDEDWTHVSYETLLNKPGESLRALCDFAGVPFGPRMESIAGQGFPPSRYTLTAPAADKWKQHEKQIVSASELFRPTQVAISALS